MRLRPRRSSLQPLPSRTPSCLAFGGPPVKTYFMSSNIASGPEIGLPGRMLAGLLPGKYRVMAGSVTTGPPPTRKQQEHRNRPPDPGRTGGGVYVSGPRMRRGRCDGRGSLPARCLCLGLGFGSTSGVCEKKSSAETLRIYGEGCNS